MTAPASGTRLELRVFESAWGMVEPLPEALQRISGAAFEGVEVNVTPLLPIDTAGQRTGAAAPMPVEAATL